MTLRLALALAFLTNLANIALFGCSAWLITRAAQHPELAVLAVAVVGVRFFGLSKAAFRYSERINSHSYTLQHLTKVRSEILRSLALAKHSPLANSSSAELVGQFLKDVDTLGERFIRGTFPIVNAAAGCAVVWTTLILWNASAGMWVALTHAVMGWVIPVLLAYARFQSSDNLQEIQSSLRTQFGNIVLLRQDFVSIGTHHKNVFSFEETNSTYSKRKRQNFQIQSFQNTLTTLTPIVLFLFALFLTLPNLQSGALAPAHAAAYFFIVMASVELTSSVGLAAETLLESRRAKDRIELLIQNHLHSQSSQRSTDHSLFEAALFQHISHQYPHSCSHTLLNFSATFPRHAITFLSGPSGSGKSTVLNILSGCLTPTAGRVVLKSDKVAAARHRDHIFAATLRENLVLGNPYASALDIEHSLKIVDLENWVKSLPEGLETFLGDGGTSVSGGERQRVLLARALLTNFSLICVDECTSHLPAQQETGILSAIASCEQTESLVVATHREPSTELQNRKHLIVLE